MQAVGKRSALCALFLLALSSCLDLVTLVSALKIPASANTGSMYRARPPLLRRALPSDPGSNPSLPATNWAEGHSSGQLHEANPIFSSLQTLIVTFQYPSARHGFPETYLDDFRLLEVLVETGRRIQLQGQTSSNDDEVLREASAILRTKRKDQPWTRPNELYQDVSKQIGRMLQTLREEHDTGGWLQKVIEIALQFARDGDKAVRETVDSVKEWAREVGDLGLVNRVPAFVATRRGDATDALLEQIRVTVKISEELTNLQQMRAPGSSAREHRDFDAVQARLKALTEQYEGLKDTLVGLGSKLNDLGRDFVSLAREAPDM